MEISQISFNAFTPDIIWRFIVIFLLLSISAALAGAEAAFFSLTPKNIKHLKTNPSPGNNAALRLLSMQDYMLATILIANNFVSICIVLVFNRLIDIMVDFGGSVFWTFTVKVVVVTFLLLLFGDIMPKITATYNPLRFATRLSQPLLFLKGLLKPFSYLLIRSSSSINEKMARKKVNISIGELSNAIEITSNHTVEEKRMLSGIVTFVNKDVVNVMKPRVDIVALSIDAGFAQVKQTIIDAGFSRIPVYEESLDNIKGILFVKDVVPYIGYADDFAWQHLNRKAYFVPEYKKINELMTEFQANHIHFAIVVDEYGSTMGLVSLEDILEEIVGEIADESDMEPEFYTKLDEDTYIFDGKAHIDDMLRVLKIKDDYLDDMKGNADTVAGLMLEIHRDFLKKGDIVVCKALTLTVEECEVRRIDKVRIDVERQAL